MADRIPEEVSARAVELYRGVIERRNLETLTAFLKDLLETGRKTHLVGRERAGGNIRRQVEDSVLLLNAYEKTGCGTTVTDIGTGAGFPGLVWKIIRPDLNLSVIERKTKMAAFLSREKRRLQLRNLQVIGLDAEMAGIDGQDGVVSKAAGKLDIILPLSCRMLRKGGAYLTIKGRDWRKEEDPLWEDRMLLESKVKSGRGVIIVFRKI